MQTDAQGHQQDTLCLYTNRIQTRIQSIHRTKHGDLLLPSWFEEVD